MGSKRSHGPPQPFSSMDLGPEKTSPHPECMKQVRQSCNGINVWYLGLFHPHPGRRSCLGLKKKHQNRHGSWGQPCKRERPTVQASGADVVLMLLGAAFPHLCVLGGLGVPKAQPAESPPQSARSICREYSRHNNFFDLHHTSF